MKLGKQTFLNTDTGGASGGTAEGTSFNPFEASHQTGHTIPVEGSTGQGNATSQQSTQQTVQPTTGGAPQTAGTQQGTQVAGQPGQAGAAGTQTQPATGTVGQQPAVVPPGVNLSPEQFRDLLATVGQPPQTQSQEPVLSEEEINARFGVVQVTEEQVAQVFRGGKEGATALTALLHGAAKMGATISSHHAINQMNKLWAAVNERLGPVTQLAAQTEQEQHTKAFFSEYNGFTEADRPVLVSVYNALQAQGFKGTPAEAYAKVASEAERIIKAYKPTFTAKNVQAGQGTQQQAGSARVQQGQQTQTQTNAPMASLVTSAGPGSGATNQQVEDQTQGSGLAKSVFGRLG
jgi:hypothetical protein